MKPTVKITLDEYNRLQKKISDLLEKIQKYKDRMCYIGITKSTSYGYGSSNLSIHDYYVTDNEANLELKREIEELKNKLSESENALLKQKFENIQLTERKWYHLLFKI